MLGIETPARPIGSPFMLFRHASLKLADFCNAWCATGVGHHMGIAYGKAAKNISRLGRIIGVETILV